MLSQSELKSLFLYHPESGIFTRLTASGGQPIGAIAGGINNGGYIHIRIKRVLHKAHRLAFLYMTGSIPEKVDHINHVRDDNHWCNLRPASSVINGGNLTLRSTNKSGIMGVNYHSTQHMWQAYISQDSVRKHLMSSKDFFEACCARKSAELEHGFHENHGRNL